MCRAQDAAFSQLLFGGSCLVGDCTATYLQLSVGWPVLGHGSWSCLSQRDSALCHDMESTTCPRNIVLNSITREAWQDAFANRMWNMVHHVEYKRTSIDAAKVSITSARPFRSIPLQRSSSSSKRPFLLAKMQWREHTVPRSHPS